MRRSHASWFFLTSRTKGDTALAWVTIRLSSPPRYGGGRKTSTNKIAFFRLRWPGTANPRRLHDYLSGHSAPKNRVSCAIAARTRGRSAGPPAAACLYVPTFSLAGFLFGEKQPGLNTRDRIGPGALSKLEVDFRKHPPRLSPTTEFRHFENSRDSCEKLRQSAR